MDTSKTGSIKSLLLQAWRERWSDILWGIRIKSVLPRGVSGDVYDLADCILQQALVGPGPNNLFMSYLMHSLSSRVVSYGAVLSSIGRYQSFYKPYCILSLLDLLKTFQSRIGSHGNEEECIALCKAVVSVTHWLYSCIFYSISKLAELKQSPEHISMMEKSYEALYYFSNSMFIKSLLYVGKFEDQGMYNQMLQKHKELLEHKLNQTSTVSVSKEVMEGALDLVNSVENLPKHPYDSVPKTNQKLQILGSTINIMIGNNAVSKPSTDGTEFVYQLLLVKKLQSFTLPQLYCEMLRACFIGITNSKGSEDLSWFAFTFIKLKHLLFQIHSQVDEKDALDKGLGILLQYTPLLDLLDLKCHCNSFHYLVNEFSKLGMLTATQMHKLVFRRQKESSKQQTQQSEQVVHSNTALILKAEVTIGSICKSLSSDLSTIQSSVLGILCHIIQKQNLELILTAVAAADKLDFFVSKLIQLNEANRYGGSETAKSAETRALMFDVTFLLLCHITQCYGVYTVIRNVENRNSFFVQWATNCLAEVGQFKLPNLLLTLCDQTCVENLLSQFLNTSEQFKTVQVKWHEIVINAPSAMKEILIAWQHGALSTEKIEIILDYIKRPMCFLPVCISAWMNNYINILHHDERVKPMNVLQQFLTPPQVESNNLLGKSPSSNDQQTPEGSLGSLYYTERSNLMKAIIQKILCSLQNESTTGLNIKLPSFIVPHGLRVRLPLAKVLVELFNNVHFKGWLDSESIHAFKGILRVSGARWFCEALIERILSYQYLKDINKAVDMVLGIFYIEIEDCALALLLHIIPFYLNNEAHEEQLAEPYSTAISRLTAMTTFAALQSRQRFSVEGSKSDCKQSECEPDISNRDSSEYRRQSKILRGNAELLEDTPFKLQSLSDEHLQNAVDNPINKAISRLMKTLMMIASDPTISARSHFPIRFLEQVVLCAKDQASAILQFMPLRLTGLLLKKFPEEFSHDLILAVSSMQSQRARKVTALSLCQLTIAQNRLENRPQY